jgi:hypothetical protein
MISTEFAQYFMEERQDLVELDLYTIAFSHSRYISSIELHSASMLLPYIRGSYTIPRNLDDVDFGGLSMFKLQHVCGESAE